MPEDTFYKAIPEPRGCGERTPGGVYVECGLGPGGSPLETFLYDPPCPLPDGVDLVNKPQLWERSDPGTGQAIIDPRTGAPIYDLLIWVGAEHYPEAADYIEETRRLGASRKLNPQMDLSKLTSQSRMLLAHPRARMLNWRDLRPPAQCHKFLPFHDQAFFENAEGEDILPADGHREACVFKLWDILPADEAIETFERPGDLPLCLRRIGSTTYQYTPTGELVRGWEPGFLLNLPISAIALIQKADGSVNVRAQEKLRKGQERHGSLALPFYETDR